MCKNNNLSDFEKLLFAIGYIKELKKDIETLKELSFDNTKRLNIEKDILKSEIDELKYDLKQNKPENHRLKAYKKQIDNLKKKKNEYKRKYEDTNHKFIMTKMELNEHLKFKGIIL